MALVLTAVSAASVQVGIRVFGEEPMPSAIWLSTLLPLLIGFPLIIYFFRKGDEIAQLNADLNTAYGELAKAHSALAETASKDGLTGVLNRAAFLHAAEKAQGGRHAGTLLLIDADHFKSINDRYGHAAGDTALTAIANAIKSQLRRDDAVGRIGGEEFAVLLKGVSEAEAQDVSERIRVAVEAISFQPEGAPALHRLSVSIGGSRMNQSRAFNDVMELADRLLYAAKSQGRNRVILQAA